MGAAIAAQALRPGLSLCLAGPLGAGKSVLARAIIRAALKDSAAEVPSPTFTLVQVYDCEAGEIWHFDLYRLSAPEEIIELGIEEAAARAIALIEWPDRMGALLPAERLDIALGTDAVAPEVRHARIAAYGGAAERALAGVLAGQHQP